MLQTILGSGGGVGIPLARELRYFTEHIRLVGRNPHRVNSDDELFAADITDPLQLDRAIAGSGVVYVTVGFLYSARVWQETWPRFISQVIASCIRHEARLVFLDNVYLYARSAIPFMTETSQIDPPGKKGKVRQQIREMILSEVGNKKLTALIARSGDFYGPDNRNSLPGILVAERMLKGKKAIILGNPDKVHTYTYTPDAAKALAVLGNAKSAFNQEWHLPTTKEMITNRNWVERFAAELGLKPKSRLIPKWMLGLSGTVVPMMRELHEMVYQHEEDYVVDSSKFENNFGFHPTAPDEGIKQTLKALKSSFYN